MEREYQQIYAINDPGLFKSCPQVEFQSENAQHLKHMLELPGVHRAWQLQHEPYAGQIGPDPAGEYMNLYEIDAPENIFDPSLGEDRLPLKAGQKFAGRHFAQLLLKTEELP